jgi:hypothetical protein
MSSLRGASLSTGTTLSLPLPLQVTFGHVRKGIKDEKRHKEEKGRKIKTKRKEDGKQKRKDYLRILLFSIGKSRSSGL